MCFFYQQQPSELFEYNILFINFKRLVTEEFVLKSWLLIILQNFFIWDWRNVDHPKTLRLQCLTNLKKVSITRKPNK